MPRPLAFLVIACSACRPIPGDSGRTWLTEPLPSPCGARQVAALALAEDGEGWVGCAGGGLLRTTDAGRTFRPEREAERLDPAQLLIEERGRLLACGGDRAPGRGGALLLARSPGGSWRTLLQPRELPGLDACRRVASSPGGALAIADLGQPGLAVSRTEGGRWRRPPGWWAGDAEAPRLYDLLSSGENWFAVGAGTVDAPLFLGPTGPQPLPLRGLAPDPDLSGDLWALATPDGGETWLAGGRSLGEERDPEAVLLRSADGGSSWEEIGLPEGLGWVRDLAFSASGGCGLALGQRAPSGDGGFALVSTDGGASWLEIATPMPGLHAGAVLDGGFLLGGEEGFLARGSCG